MYVAGVEKGGRSAAGYVLIVGHVDSNGAAPPAAGSLRAALEGEQAFLLYARPVFLRGCLRRLCLFVCLLAFL